MPDQRSLHPAKSGAYGSDKKNATGTLHRGIRQRSQVAPGGRALHLARDRRIAIRENMDRPRSRGAEEFDFVGPAFDHDRPVGRTRNAETTLGRASLSMTIPKATAGRSLYQTSLQLLVSK